MTGKEVRELRAELCLTQPMFGKLLGVTWRTVSRWERGFNLPKDDHRQILMAFRDIIAKNKSSAINYFGRFAYQGYAVMMADLVKHRITCGTHNHSRDNADDS